MVHSRRALRVLWGAVLACLGAAMLFTSGVVAQSNSSEGQDPALVVRELVVEGNVEIDSERILAAVTATKVGEPFVTENIQKDVNSIAELGFFENVEARPSATQDGGVRVTFVVDEFPVVRKIEVEVVDGVVEPGEVAALFSVAEGEILNAKVFSDELDALPVKSGESLSVILRPTQVELRGEEGDELYLKVTPVRLGKIVIEGNEKTKEIVIRREIPLESGEILDLEKLGTGLRRLGQLGYFEPIVPEFLVTEDPLVVDVLIPVVENKTGRAAFGAGYSTSSGLVGYIEVADDNLLGRGERARVKAEFGQLSTLYDIGFDEPYLFGTNISAGFNLYNQRNRLQEEGHPYTVRRLGGDVTFGRPLGAFTRGSLTLKVENSSVKPDTGPPNPVTESENRTRSVIFNTRTDTTDHLFYPTGGFRHNFSFETAGHFLGGDTEFNKIQTAFSTFAKAGRNNQTWAFRVIAGYGFGTLPLQEQFRVGGADTVRGYHFGEFTGDRMFVAQAEYRFPITQTVQGVVFADAGNAWEDEAIDLRDLKAGVGIGIRFNTPLGMMRIDYGIGENGGNAYFSLGPTF